ncbi:16S rRNA-processing protein RimM [Weissella koreensis KACC 15510]|uniref:ribosome maturation factor RimM n=1 Tax=Weissella koreensis TaxID=165096 RepID=UPI0002175A46|nr:ribosome maturation factor RimM [Weissella koreensis]AEJ22988.1 16S rRNA-processing protein RimM [Weissella koreensis KACC 15510]
MSLYKVGTIVNTHGIKGEVRVISTTDFSTERFVPGNKMVIGAKNNVEVEIATVRNHKQFILLSFKDLQNINFIEKYKGMDLMVDDTQIPVLDQNEYFYHDIVGLSIINNEDQSVIGTVKEILELPANDVWVIQRKQGSDLLIPFTEQVVKEINLDDKTAKVVLLEEWVADEN